MPEGVVVLGMHRSGTSLVTRLISLLGIEVCRQNDLLPAGPRNPRGHWESVSLNAYNDRLLEELGGSWFCPPPMDAEETAGLLERHAGEGLAAVQYAHPQRPWVWKDPRICPLMPFWATVLSGRVVYVLVARHPFEVSDSLAARNGFTSLLSMAMWERYTRQAMLGAAGSPAIACTYDEVLSDPLAWCEQLAAFLGELGVPTRGVDRQAVEAFAMGGLRHSSKSWTELQPGPEISAEQVELAQASCVSTAQSTYAPPLLPGETPQTTAIFRELIDSVPKPALDALPARLVTPRGATDSGGDSSPPVSVVLARGDASTVRATLAALGDALPAGSEVLVPAGAGEGPGGGNADGTRGVDDIGAAGDSPDLTLREFDAGGALGGAAALALGAHAANGRLVLLTNGLLTGSQPWYAPLEATLAGRRVGGVGPAMRFQSDPDALGFGRFLADEQLTARPLPGWAEDGPVRVPLLASALSLYTRRVLDAAGGIDGEFSSAAAAVDELSMRLWRMGFRCMAVPQVEAGEPAPDSGEAHDDVGRLHDRMRIATLHLGPERLRAFLERARREPAFEQAAARLAASDTERRRAAIEVVCSRSGDWFLDSFPPGRTGPVAPAQSRRAKLSTIEKIRQRVRGR